MTFNLRQQIIYLTLTGSRAYGTHTKDSDWDYRGVACDTLESKLGFRSHFEQAVDNEGKTLWKLFSELGVKPNSDLTVFELGKFVQLALKCNPNIIEILFCDSSSVLYCHQIFEKLLEHREDFLSLRAKGAFSGYAFDQLKKIKLHRQWLLDPPKEPPIRKEFGLPEYNVISLDEIGAAEAYLKQCLEDFIPYIEDLTPSTRIEMRNHMFKSLKLAWMALNQTPYPVGNGKSFLHLEEALFQLTARIQGYNENFLQLLQREKEYRNALKNWDDYQRHLKTRNQKRLELEKKHGYDCYVEETEFLTKTGWKSFDSITEEDELATINKKTFEIEYQKYIDKFDGKFSGNLYNVYGYHTDLLVTPNHRLFFQKEERNTGKKYDWDCEQVSAMPDCFNMLRTITPITKNYTYGTLFNGIPIKTEAYLRLMGWFLSDGTITFKNDEPDCIVVDQLIGGKLYGNMIKFLNKYKEEASISQTFYTKEINETRKVESKMTRIHVRNKFIVNKIYEECGHAKEKRIPRWCFSLSKRLMDILLDALIGGDGTVGKPDNGIIYYSSVKNLADDVQELALMCGYETSLYGPYSYPRKDDPSKNTLIYQVYINKTREQFKNFVRCNNIKKIEVKDKRIICFTVKNDTLVTRHNGHIGFACNSKNASHLVRLIRMAKEIVTLEKVFVKRPDAEELQAIRNGAWTYDQLIEYAEKENQELEKLARKSKLQSQPPIEKIQKVVIEMHKQFYKVNGK